MTAFFNIFLFHSCIHSSIYFCGTWSNKCDGHANRLDVTQKQKPKWKKWNSHLIGRLLPATNQRQSSSNALIFAYNFVVRRLAISRSRFKSRIYAILCLLDDVFLYMPFGFKPFLDSATRRALIPRHHDFMHRSRVNTSQLVVNSNRLFLALST